MSRVEARLADQPSVRFGWQVVLLLILLLAGCTGMTNYEEPDGPIYTGEYAPADFPFDGRLKVITWNIRFGREVEQAIAELASTPELADADLLLLQEMDAAGVEAMAQALGYNYIYYPASLHSRHDREFGNAVLCKWPLVDSQKVLLPNENWKNGQRRTAVLGVADIESLLIDAYSVHTETLWMGSDARFEQFDAMADSVGDGNEPAIIGGDFNTLTPASKQRLFEPLAEVGFERVAPAEASTYNMGTFDVGMGLTADHLFVRGFSVEESGVWSETEASDHYPVWALLRIQ